MALLHPVWWRRQRYDRRHGYQGLDAGKRRR